MVKKMNEMPCVQLNYLIGEVSVAERPLTLMDIEKLVTQMSVIPHELVIF